MSPLTFAMGRFEAKFPTDRLYSRHHMWLQRDAGRSADATTYRVGLTDYSVRLLQDVYFLDWAADAPLVVARRQAIGEVESSKAMSSLYAPAGGTVVRFNDALMSQPELINTANYDAGWLFDLQTDDDLMSPDGYVKLLAEIWDDTQRTLQGQANT